MEVSKNVIKLFVKEKERGQKDCMMAEERD